MGGNVTYKDKERGTRKNERLRNTEVELLSVGNTLNIFYVHVLTLRIKYKLLIIILINVI